MVRAWGRKRKAATARGYRDQPRPEMMRFLPPGRKDLKVLEIGCGEGVFAASIPVASELWGIEPDATAAAKAAIRLKTVFADTFVISKPLLPERYFDLIVCNDVIEHMADADEFLKSIQDHMAPGGHLVGSIPNARYYKNLYDFVIGRDWEYKDSGIMDRTHLRFFTIKSLRNSLDRAGFRIEALKGIKSGIRTAFYPKSIAYSVFAYCLIAMTLGRAADIRHLQIAFRVSRLPPPAPV